MQQLAFNLQRVICSDETGGSFVEKVGNDEIWLSGFGIDATGATVKLDPFEIFANFDDGEVKEFPSTTLFTLNVPNEGTFPKTCTVGLLLAERADGAGHSVATEQAFAKANEMIALQSPKPDGGLSVVTAAVAAAIQEEVKNWVMGIIDSGLNDNVFPVQTASLDVSSPDFFWGDGTKLSPETTVEFRGHDGLYHLVYFWEMRTV